jgi:hypothetical protein
MSLICLSFNSSVSVNSCMRPLATLDGVSIITTEGIGSTVTNLHPIQQRFVFFLLLLNLVVLSSFSSVDWPRLTELNAVTARPAGS